MDQKKIGQLIASKRKDKGLTQEQLAEMLGVTNKAVSKWETGKSMPDVAIIQALCKILGITVTTLLNGEENKDEELVLKLYGFVQKMKANLKSLYLIGAGLVLANLAELLLDSKLVHLAEEGTFYSGMIHGALTGLLLSGACAFGAGIALFIKKSRE